MATGRLSWTMNMIKTPSASAPEAPFARADRLVTWILLGLGLLLMLASIGSAEEASVSRVDRFNGSLKSGQTIHVENISGDIVATPGKEFSAVVNVTAYAGTAAKAQELLAATHIVNDHDEDGWSLETRWPGMRGSGRHGSLCDRCRIVARYEIVVPPGVTAELQTVNGDVRVRDCAGELKLESVNGTIEALGVRQALDARTVNGRINAVAQSLSSEAAMELQSVNGSVALTLPRDAKFELSASTMNGTIASTFPLPVHAVEISPAEPPARREHGKAPKEPADHPNRVIVKTEDGETTVVDLRDLERELESSMRDVEVSIEEGMRDAEGKMEAAQEGLREAQRELRRVRIGDPRKEYTGSIGRNGANISLQTLNGGVLLLAAGTREEDAKPLVSERRSFVVTIPRVEVHVARHPPVPPAPPAPPVGSVPPVPPVPPAPAAPRAPRPPAPPPPEFEGEVVRGDVAGDFLSTSTGGNYRVGKVSGRVRILTHSGEIRLGGAGAGADLKSYGGDVVVGPVTGDLNVTTMAGEIRADAVTGSVLADTAGGDIRVARVGGSLDAKTAGGDIVAPFVGGAVRAVTAGGDVRIGVTSREVPGGITIHNSGGDVTLALPADARADLELIVTGAEEDESAIRSEFPELTISKRAGVQRATAKLNGGGEKVVVKTSSGTIRLKKGTAQ